MQMAPVPLRIAYRFVDELVQTSHSDKISDLAFPHEYSEVFATAGTPACLPACQALHSVAVAEAVAAVQASTTSASGTWRPAASYSVSLCPTWSATASRSQRYDDGSVLVRSSCFRRST